MAWDSSSVRASMRWLILALAMVVIVGAIVAAIVLSMVTTRYGLNTIIPSLFIALSSTLLHLVQIWLPLTTGDHTCPRLRTVLAGTLVVISPLHVVFIILLAVRHDDFYFKLSRLVCIFHAVLTESITRAWTYARGSSGIGMRLLIYVTISLEVGSFGVGVWLLFHNNIQLMWGLPTIPLWRYFIIVACAFFQIVKNPLRVRWPGSDLKMFGWTCATCLGALTSSSLLWLGVARRWNPNVLFFAEFALIQGIRTHNFRCVAVSGSPIGPQIFKLQV